MKKHSLIRWHNVDDDDCRIEWKRERELEFVLRWYKA